MPAGIDCVEGGQPSRFPIAAIVAREPCIPAGVGCNDAALRLQTGDRLRVDGGLGTAGIPGSGSG
jgi:phosphoenolpyruvate-protein kinase (PTS system EI component)